MKTFLKISFFFLLVTQICFGQWYQQNSGTTKQLYAVQFVDENYGWAVGDSGIIINTTNGGSYWTQQSSGTTNALSSVFFTDTNNGTVVGDGTILRTTNGGANWILQEPGIFNFQLQSVFFSDSNIGTTVGGIWSWISWAPLILRTTNGGESWIEQIIEMALVLPKNSDTDENMGMPVPFYGVCFTDTNTGTVVGTYGILYTTDGGNNWTRHSSDTTSWLCSICFTDANTGTVVGSDGIIRRTTNGGTDWLLQSSGTTKWLNSVCFTDANTGTVVGSDGIILRTTNGGTDWIQQSSETEIITLNGVTFTDSNMGTAVGYDGIMLRTTNGGVSFIEEEQIDKIPIEFSLSQNYPNPFNPTTKIKYSIPTLSQVTLKIFNVLGSEIETLVNVEKSVGTYELNWNATNLPSGVYFYRLQAGSFVETKKMILLK